MKFINLKRKSFFKSKNFNISCADIKAFFSYGEFMSIHNALFNYYIENYVDKDKVDYNLLNIINDIREFICSV